MCSDFIGSRAALAIIAGLFASYSWASTEDRINAAIPLPQAVLLARTALLGAAGGSERAQVEAAFKAKLRVRAIECSQGYSPGPFTSSAAMREHLANSTVCFDRHDDKLARWIGLQRVGHLLRMPPLRSIPTTLSANIFNSQSIDGNGIHFAADAGVVLFRNSHTLETFDLNNGMRIARIEAEQPSNGRPELSPNARVLALFGLMEVKLIDAETGESLVRLPLGRDRGFCWLGGSRALYARAGAGAATTTTVDFDTGEERPNDLRVEGVQYISAIPRTSDELLLLADTASWRLQVPRRTSGQPLIVIDHKDLPNAMVRTDGEFTSDDQWYVSAQRDLKLISTATLETTTITMAPLEVRTAIPLHNPDLLLLECMAPRSAADGWPRYVYSISRKTLALVDTQRLAYPRFIYIPSLRQLGLIERNHLTTVDTLATQPAIPLEQVRADLTEQVNQYRAHVGEQTHAASNVVNTRLTTSPARWSGPPIHLGIGDSVATVQHALHTSKAPVPMHGSDPSAVSELHLRDRGLWVLFDKANRAQQYRFEAPFGGDIDGARIGAWVGDVRGRLGRAVRSIPSTSPAEGDINVYHIDSGVTIRCDFDKNNSVQTIRLLAGSVTFTESNAPAH
jgi:hypothetical protein